MTKSSFTCPQMQEFHDAHVTKCDRCRKKTLFTSMSVFNTEIICNPCKYKEEKRPDFAEARKAEIEAVRRGDYNFPGIGLE